jgi:O-antigen/teichoic acid export membrane protein
VIRDLLAVAKVAPRGAGISTVKILVGHRQYLVVYWAILAAKDLATTLGLLLARTLGLRRQALASPICVRSALAFVLRAMGAALTFVTSFLFARALGVEQYGAYVFWITLASMVATFASFGTPNVVIKQVAAARGEAVPARLSRGITYGAMVALTTVVVLVLFGTVASVVSNASNGSEPWVLLTPAFIAFLGAAIGHYNSILHAILLGFERVLDSQLVGLMVPLVTAACALTLWMGPGEWATASGALWLTVLAATIGTAATTVLLCMRVSPSDLTPCRLADLVGHAPAWFRLGMLFAVNQFLVNAITQIDILMLGWLSTSEATAYYHAASRIAYACAFFFGSVTSVIGPTIARLHAAGRAAELARSVQNASLLAFLGTALLAITVLTLGDHVLKLFGPRFIAAESVLYILVSTWVVHAFFGIAHTVLMMAGAPGHAALGLAVAALVNIALNAALIPLWDAVGAAAASFVSTLGFAIVFSSLVLRRHGVRTDALSAILASKAGRTAVL